MSVTGGPKITVPLQENYKYILWPLILCVAAVIVAFIIYFFATHKKPKKKAVVDVQKVWRALSENEKYLLRMKYFKLLDDLYAKTFNGQISIRQCYQNLSRYIRSFVAELTGIKVTKCTLNDIERMNMPMLAALIREFYAVEFAKVSTGDAGDAIIRTKRVIEIWN